MWLNHFKKALILEEVDQLSSLLDEMPQFETLEQMEEAAFLLQQCKTLIQTKKSDTSKTLQQLKSGLNFFDSVQTNRTHTLNLKF